MIEVKRSPYTRYFSPIVNVLPGIARSSWRSSSGKVAELRRRSRGRWLRRSSSAGPRVSCLVAGITDICQVSVGSSACCFGGWWRRRRGWRWWWASCTTWTIAHSCLPQSLPAQLGEHTASPMAVALADQPLLSRASSRFLLPCSARNVCPLPFTITNRDHARRSF